jgi:inner membrane transporter RhtA
MQVDDQLRGPSAIERILSRGPTATLVLGSVVAIQTGHACGKLLFGLVDPMGVIALRLGFTALVLCVLWRPRLPTDRRSLGLIVGWGAAIAGMQTIYLALAIIPVGTAVALQFLGPLTVALAGSRRPSQVLWALLAGLGVFLFHSPGTTAPPVAGTIFALGSGACWAAYIVLTRRAGVTHAADRSALALAVGLAALLCVPLGVVEAGPDIARPGVLLAGLGVAVLSAVVPWSLDLTVLRRLSSPVFGVLVSLEPALGGAAGMLIVGEHLAVSHWVAIGCVVGASLGAVRTKPESDRRDWTARGPGAVRRARRVGWVARRCRWRQR